jgi:predicted enzyme related to lactoylglutathione lyase
MDRVVHFEIPAEDVERAKTFYASVFGWEIEDVPEMDYTSVRTVPVDERFMPTEPGAINGGLVRRRAETPSPVVTINVDSIEATLARIEAAGGAVIHPRHEIAGMGAYAYFRDTEGNAMGLWESAPGM